APMRGPGAPGAPAPAPAPAPAGWPAALPVCRCERTQRTCDVAWLPRLRGAACRRLKAWSAWVYRAPTVELCCVAPRYQPAIILEGKTTDETNHPCFLRLVPGLRYRP